MEDNIKSNLLDILKYGDLVNDGTHALLEKEEAALIRMVTSYVKAALQVEDVFKDKTLFGSLVGIYEKGFKDGVNLAINNYESKKAIKGK